MAPFLMRCPRRTKTALFSLLCLCTSPPSPRPPPLHSLLISAHLPELYTLSDALAAPHKVRSCSDQHTHCGSGGRFAPLCRRPCVRVCVCVCVCVCARARARARRARVRACVSACTRARVCVHLCAISTAIPNPNPFAPSATLSLCPGLSFSVRHSLCPPPSPVIHARNWQSQRPIWGLCLSIPVSRQA